MSKKNIEELSTELLTKKRKFASFILGVLIGVSIIVIITSIWTGKYTLLLSLAGLIAVSIPMTNGLKKINIELSKKNNSGQSVSPE
jgi:VIT1/CCC1 family predicted Fe2+/Mn2+ transporter